MDIKISHIHRQFHNALIRLPGSKSETNRALLLQALFPEVSITNISDSDDSTVMQQALLYRPDTVDVHHAGTAMRFLTAYFAIQRGKNTIVTGSDRMKQRPIQILTDTLQKLGAEISYLDKEGYPPLCTNGKILNGGQVAVDASISSQYISALLLIAPKLKNGLQLQLNGTITSLPYITMTLSLLEKVGIKTDFTADTISVKPKSYLTKSVVIDIESDWSAASYYYSAIAMSPIGSSITLSRFKVNSFQGDSAIAKIYTDFGVKTNFKAGTIILTKVTNIKPTTLNISLRNTPDIAQTLIITCFGLNVICKVSGLQTLKIKETDRLIALQSELAKFNAKTKITNDTFILSSGFIHHSIQSQDCIAINTYNDHRMAMSFAPLALRTRLIIKNAEVVSKSYPEFWNHFEQLGFIINRS